MAVYNPAVREPERGTDGEQSRYGISQAIERPKQKSEHLSPDHPQKRLSHPKEPPDVERSFDRTTSRRSERRCRGRAYFNE